MEKQGRRFVRGVAALVVGLAAMGGGRVVAAEITEEENRILRELYTTPYSEESFFRTDRLLVTATGSQLPVHKAPSVATLITKEDIADMGATSLDEVLETVPGIHVGVSQSGYFNSVWSIRGLHTTLSPQVLLLVNGVPFSEPANASRPHGFNMPVAMISRVEVVRGPGSAVHGADAFAATINVITKDAHEVSGLRTGVRAGSFETHAAWLQYGINAGGWDVVASTETRRSQGDNNRIIGQDNYAYTRTLPGFGALPANGSLAPAALDSDYDTLDSHLGVRKGGTTFRLYSSLQNNNALGLGAGQIVTYGNEYTSSSLLAELLHEEKNLFPDLDVSLRVSSFSMKGDIYLQYFPDGTRNQYGNPIYESGDAAIEPVIQYKGWIDHRWRLAGGLKHFDTDTDQYRNFGADLPAAVRLQFPLTDIRSGPYTIYMERQNRAMWYASLQDEWHLARKWDLTAGVRYDHYSDFGSTTNPRAALVWETLPVLTSKVLYGTAFRAPAFSEQHMVSNPVALGNPTIKPEEIETIELVLDYQPTPRFHPVLSLFSYKTDGMIDYVGSTTSKTAQNSKNLRGEGFEVDLEWEPRDDFRLRTNFALQRTKDINTGEIVPEAPGKQFYLNPHWRFAENWSLDGQLHWVGDRRRSASDTRPQIDDYELVNLTLRRKNLLKHWEMALAVRNLFDEDVREPAGFLNADNSASVPYDIPMPSRSVWAELRFSY